MDSFTVISMNSILWFNSSPDNDQGLVEEFDSDSDNERRPCFEAIAKNNGSLDKTLAASGFTGQSQDELEKFVFEKTHNDDETSSDNEDNLGEESTCHESELTGDITGGVDTLLVNVNGDYSTASSCGLIVDDRSNDRMDPVSVTNNEYDMDQHIAVQDSSVPVTAAGKEGGDGESVTSHDGSELHRRFRQAATTSSCIGSWC